MKLHFESDLPYQAAAIESVCDLFHGQEICRSVFTVTAQALTDSDQQSFEGKQFTAEGGGLTGWSDPIYSQRLAESAQQTGSARCALLADCERQLLEGCAVVPLLGQNRRLLVADGITGLVFDPFTPVLDLTDAQKN